MLFPIFPAANATRSPPATGHRQPHSPDTFIPPIPRRSRKTVNGETTTRTTTEPPTEPQPHSAGCSIPMSRCLFVHLHPGNEKKRKRVVEESSRPHSPPIKSSANRSHRAQPIRQHSLIDIPPIPDLRTLTKQLGKICGLPRAHLNIFTAAQPPLTRLMHRLRPMTCR